MDRPSSPLVGQLPQSLPKRPNQYSSVDKMSCTPRPCAEERSASARERCASFVGTSYGPSLRIPEDLPEAVCELPRVSVGVTEDLSCLGVVLSRIAYPEIADVSEYEVTAVRTLLSVDMGVANTGSSSGGGGTGGSARPVSGQMWPRHGGK